MCWCHHSRYCYWVLTVFEKKSTKQENSSQVIKSNKESVHNLAVWCQCCFWIHRNVGGNDLLCRTVHMHCGWTCARTCHFQLNRCRWGECGSLLCLANHSNKSAARGGPAHGQKRMPK